VSQLGLQQSTRPIRPTAVEASQAASVQAAERVQAAPSKGNGHLDETTPPDKTPRTAVQQRLIRRVLVCRCGIALDPASTVMTRPAPGRPDLETTRLTASQLAAARAGIAMIRDAAGLPSVLAGRRPA
jgi:hypothetical protein